MKSRKLPGLGMILACLLVSGCVQVPWNATPTLNQRVGWRVDPKEEGEPALERVTAQSPEWQDPVLHQVKASSTEKSLQLSKVPQIDSLEEETSVEKTVAVAEVEEAQPSKLLTVPPAEPLIFPRETGIRQASYESPVTETSAELAMPESLQPVAATDPTALLIDQLSKANEPDRIEIAKRLVQIMQGERWQPLEEPTFRSPDACHYWNRLLSGMENSWKAGQLQGDILQTTLSARELEEAIRQLRKHAALTVPQIVFCQAIRSYGDVDRFPSSQFTSKQEVLVYAELENFCSCSQAECFETRLISRYEILDTNETILHRQQFPATFDRCQHQRRDYFQSYRLSLPPLNPGHYRFRLYIQDETSGKLAQAELPFQIIP
ncbi:Hypothetical protein PBC10988_37200 [Planctomycetales bacterium 10988]|nr:Hypothetical protein PBC10988_37200 [Planctomycetales bacterium 10988]